MKSKTDAALLETYIKEYGIDQYFTDIEKVKPGMELLTIPKNTFLYSRPEHHKYAYFLLKGKMKIYTATEDGRQMLVRSCDDFIFIGDMELLGYREPANTVETSVKCLFIGIDILLYGKDMMADPKFLQFLCNCLAEKLAYFAGRQFQNNLNTSEEKLAAYILQNSDKKGFFRENLREVSETLRISYRNLHRMLNRLIEKGALERVKNGYQITDSDKMKNI